MEIPRSSLIVLPMMRRMQDPPQKSYPSIMYNKSRKLTREKKKNRLMLWLGLQVAWEIPFGVCPRCIYLSLEDTQRRIKDGEHLRSLGLQVQDHLGTGDGDRACAAGGWRLRKPVGID